MQGKLVFSQFPSTRLFLNRFNMLAYPSVPLSNPSIQTPPFQRGKMEGTAEEVGRPFPIDSLLTQGEIRFGVACDRHRLRLALGALVPCCHGVTAVGNVFNLVFAGLVGGREIGCG